MVLINKIRYQLNQKIKESQNAEPVKPEKPHYSQAGAGLRSLKSTTAFRAINFELYVRPNIIVMSIGIVAFTFVVGYISWMRAKYEGMGYYVAVQEDGTEHFTKRKSKWEN